MLVAISALIVIDRGLLIASAYAEDKPPKPIEDAKKAVETLINHLRGRFSTGSRCSERPPDYSICHRCQAADESPTLLRGGGEDP